MARDYTGCKFNKLTLITRIGGGGAQKGAIWLAECECGNTREVMAKEVARGRVRSCGKCREVLVKARPRTAAEKRPFHRAARQAVREGTNWALNIEEYMGIVQKGCLICQEAAPVLVQWEEAGGYTLGNTYALCRNCNHHRHGRNIREFIIYLEHAYQSLSNRINNA